MSDPRDQLRQAIKCKLAGYADPVVLDKATDEVMRLFWTVGERIDENETTTYGDTNEQIIWSRILTAEHAVESGSYTGKPRLR